MKASYLQNWLYKISAHLPCRVINGNQRQPYLERYYLLSLPFGFQMYLHRFVASDPGKGLHNHPWKFAISMILSGHYVETRLNHKASAGAFRKKILKAGRLNYINGEIYHRIDISPGHQAWSLFIHSKKMESWGFLHSENKQFAYMDHNEVVHQHNQPHWWESASKAVQKPDMRSPLKL